MFNTLTSICMLLFRVQILVVMTLLERLGLVLNQSISDSDEKDQVLHKIIRAKDIHGIALARGYVAHEHVITTKDNYLLVVHKLVKEGHAPLNNESNKIAYFHHGLLTNSELFLLGETNDKVLPFLLLEEGYEVWLGNNRGNKYSRKHLELSVCDNKFWDFSLDEFALYDIPDTLEYISQQYSPSSKITYIGFSQGCSQLFASLSLKPDLNKKLSLFVALSPAIVPKNLKHPIFRILVQQAAHDDKFLPNLFGKRALISSVTFWSYMMGLKLYEKVVDTCLTYLFGWSGKNLSAAQKRIGYPHMFSNSSVKALTHWFQIIHAKRFQMFDETGNYGLTSLSIMAQGLKDKGHRVMSFPILPHLNVPILLVYGDDDILVDIDNTMRLILDQNPNMKDKFLKPIQCPRYEHMDTIWGSNVYEDVFSKVLSSMKAINSDGRGIHLSKLSEVPSYSDRNDSNDSLYN